jgi:hypothetical protein
VNELVLAGGAPIEAGAAGRDRIGLGPWARLVASAIVPDESSARAERGRELARAGAVSRVSVAVGAVRARVVGSSGAEYDVSLETAPLAPTAWTEAVRAARDLRELEDGVAGAVQSVHLLHHLEAELHESLVPPMRRIRTSCTCPDRERSSLCKHVAATAFVLADAIDGDPSLLLRWRGCVPAAAPASRAGDPWSGGELPPPRPRRALPPGAVVKRLGRSGIRVGGRDLADALEPAYRAFAATSAEPPGGMIDGWSSDSAS